MSTRTKPRKVVNSRNLAGYKLKKSTVELLNRASALRDYMCRGGKQPPSSIRLYRADFNDIDDAVRAQSEKKYSARDVTWGGVPIIAHDESKKPLTLEAA